jgi:hypothetical protein
MACDLRAVLRFFLLCAVLISSSSSSSSVGGGDDNGGEEAASCLNCLPHECLGVELEAAEQQRLLRRVRRELDALPAEPKPPPPWPLGGEQKNRAALLITAGGPPRAESVVQAHVLMSAVRRLHGDLSLPVELWHAGEPGMADACRVWETAFHLFSPFACQNAWERAVAPPPRPPPGRRRKKKGSSKATAGPGKASTALAVALGLDAATERAFREETLRPSLEWVRGWPIKPLALLLTRWDTVVMLDADSMPLRPLQPWLRRIANVGDGGDGRGGGDEDDGDGGVVRALSRGTNLFWPDIMERGKGHRAVRDALGLLLNETGGAAVPGSSGSGSGGGGGGGSGAAAAAAAAALDLAAESGQMVVDTVRARAAVRAAWVLNAHPVVYTLLHGDKDTYRLAFDFAAQKAAAAAAAAATSAAAAGGGGDGGKAAEKAASVLRYQQVPYEPMALGALGPQAMADGSNAAPPLPQQRAGAGAAEEAEEGVDVGAAARPNNFCGQALLQRGPASGAPVFVHRVLAKYNLMNLASEASWAWTTAPSPEVAGGTGGGGGGGHDDVRRLPSLEQHGWCLNYRTAEGDVAAAAPELLELAKHAIDARKGMGALF